MKWDFRLQANSAIRQAELDIYDVVGDPYMGVTSYGVLQQLRTLDVDQIVVRINSVGGVVTDGMDIYNLLNAHQATIITRVSGVAASIASIILQAGDIRQVYANSQVMIHDPYATFDVFSPPLREQDMRRNADMLARIKSQMLDIYAKRAGKTPEDFAPLCAVETWMTAEEAVAYGLADSVVDDEADMLISAKAWESKMLQAVKAPKSLVLAARAAQVPVAKNINKQDTKMKNKITVRATLPENVAAKASSDGEISDEDLSSLAESAKAAEERAKAAEAELKELSKKAAEFEKHSEKLKAAEERASKAESDLEDLRKQMSDAKAAKDPDDDGDDDSDESGDDDDDADAKAKAAARNVAVKAMTRGALKRLARTAMVVTDCADPSAVSGALMAIESKLAKVPDAKAIHATRVSAMIASGKLLPSRKSWAMRATTSELDTYEKILGGATVGPVGTEHAPNPKAAAEIQTPPGDPAAPAVLSADTQKILAQMAPTPAERERIASKLIVQN